MKLIYLLFPVLILVSCKGKTQLKDGDKISSIEQNVVTGINGATLELSNGSEDRTYYLFRHAEKDTLPKSNPVLNNIGYERSYKIADIFRRTKIDKIYSTFYNRTMHTVDSLATTKGIVTSIYTPKKMKSLSEEIKVEENDKNYVIVGHSNTIPGMVNLLMGNKIIDQNIDESVYDNFYIVDVKVGQEPVLYSFRF